MIFDVSCWKIVIVNSIVIFKFICLFDFGGKINLRNIMDEIR